MNVILVILGSLVLFFVVRHLINNGKRNRRDTKMTFLTLHLIREKYDWGSGKQELKKFLSLFYKVTMNLNNWESSKEFKGFGKKLFLNTKNEFSFSDKNDYKNYITQLKEYSFIPNIQELSVDYYVETITRFKIVIDEFIEQDKQEDRELTNLISYYVFFHNEFTKLHYRHIMSTIPKNKRSKLKLNINGDSFDSI